MLLLILVLILLILGVYLYLGSGSGRALARDIALAEVNKLIRGELRVGSIERLGAGGVTLVDVSVLDSAGRTVAEIGEVAADLDVGALISGGDIVVKRVSIIDPTVRLHLLPNGQISLLQAVSPANPREPEPDDGGSPPVILIHNVQLQGGRVEADDDLALGLDVVDLELALGVTIGETIQVESERLSLGIVRDSQPIAVIESNHLVFDTSIDSATTAELTVTGHDNTGVVSIHASALELLTEQGPTLDAQLLVDHLSPRLLEALGLLAADTPLPEWLSLDLHVEGRIEALDAEGTLTTPGGEIALDAEVIDLRDATLTLTSSRLALAQVSPAAPPFEVAFDIGLASAVDEAGVRAASLSLREGSLDGDALPDLSLSAHLETDAVTLDHLELPHLDDRFSLSGRYGFDNQAAVELHVERLDLATEPWIQLFLPNSRGRISIDLDGRIDLAAARFDADADVVATDLSLPGLSVGDARIVASGSGPLERPVLDAEISLTSVDVGGTRIRRATVEATGGRRQVELVGQVVPAELPEAAFDIVATYEGRNVVVDGLIRVTQDGETADVLLADVVVDPTYGVDFGVTRVQHPSVLVAASGRYDFETGPDLDLLINRLDLGLFDGRLGLPDLPVGGTVTGQLTLAGDPTRPLVEASLRWRNGVVGPVSDTEAELSLELGPDGLSVDARVALGSAAEMQLSGGADFTSYTDPVEALMGADYSFDLFATARDLELVRSVIPDLPVSGGSVQATIAVDGPLDGATVDLLVVSNRLEVLGRPPVDVSLQARIDNRASHIDGLVRHASGDEMVSLQLNAGFGLDVLTSGVDLHTLKREEWGLNLSLPRQSLEELALENPFDDSLPAPIPLTVGLLLDANSPAGRPAAVRIKGQVTADLSELAQASTCGDVEEAEVHFQLDAGHESSGLAAVLLFGTERPFQLEVDPGLAMGDVWADPANVLSLAQATIEGRIDDLDLGRVPFLCQHASGLLDGAVSGSGLLTDSPSVRVSLHATDLQPGTSFSFDAESLIEVLPEGASADIAIHPSEGGSSTITGVVPLAWSELGVPAISEGDIQGRLDLDRLPTATIAGLVSPLRRGEGILDGTIEIGGPLDAPWFVGDLLIEDVDVMLPGLDQRLTNVNGQVVLTPGSIQLERLSAEDYDGEMVANGDIQLEGLQLREVYLRLRADNFPMRQSGSIAARLSTDARVRADMSAELVTATVTIQDTNIALPETSAGSVQALERNPDVLFASELAQLQRGEEVVIEEITPETVVRVELDASEPFWVRRNDFSIQMTAQLEIDADSAGARISGPVVIRRGNLSFFGKDFELEEGSIQFSGAQDLNPLVDLVAIHELSRYPGENVTLTIGGRLSEPTLRLTTTLAGVATQAEITQLLVTGRFDDGAPQETADAGEQAASLLSGMMAGILTSAARTELGAALPVISVETGQETGEVGLRAGFIADDLIPSFMRGVIRGAYVEGYVQSESQEDANQETSWGAIGGLLIELYFSAGVLTAASVEPPSNWSFDVLWRP